MAENAHAGAVEQLDVRTCWALLRSTPVGRLAVLVNEWPEIFPVNHLVDHGSVIFRTAPGTKLAAAVISKRVAFEADGYDAETRVAWSVVVRGRADVVRNLHELVNVSTLPLYPWHGDPKNYFVRIESVEVTGRRFTAVDPSIWHTRAGASKMPD